MIPRRHGRRTRACCIWLTCNPRLFLGAWGFLLRQYPFPLHPGSELSIGKRLLGVTRCGISPFSSARIAISGPMRLTRRFAPLETTHLHSLTCPPCCGISDAGIWAGSSGLLASVSRPRPGAVACEFCFASFQRHCAEVTGFCASHLTGSWIPFLLF